MVTTSTDEDFNPTSSIFICNKWDTVPTGDRAKVQEGTFDKLQKYYQGIHEEQIFRLSVEEVHAIIEI